MADGLSPAVLSSWMQEFIQGLPDAVLVAEAGSGRILLSNRMSLLEGDGPWTLGEEGLKQRIFHLEGPQYEPGESPLMRSLATGEEIVGEEFAWFSPHGDRRCFSCNCTPIRDRDGEIIAGISVMRDITTAARDREVIEALRTLTPREVEVLQALAEGLDSHGVADKLGITIRTQRNHVARILLKLEVHSQLQALVLAVRHGVVEIR